MPEALLAPLPPLPALEGAALEGRLDPPGPQVGARATGSTNVTASSVPSASTCCTANSRATRRKRPASARMAGARRTGTSGPAGAAPMLPADNRAAEEVP
jgi:hypothetical protein